MNRNLLIIAVLALLAGGVWIFQQKGQLIGTGHAVAVDLHPYHHLSYVKLAPDHNGNFTGDLYLLDLPEDDITKLTQGGITGSSFWLDSEELLITRRPKGSVVDPFYLNANSGRIKKGKDQMLNGIFYQAQFDEMRSPSGRYFVIPLETLAGQRFDRYAILLASAEGVETRLTVKLNFAAKISWVPQSDMLVYGDEDERVCLLDLIKLEEVCRPGVSPIVSPSVVPKLVAFVDKTGDGNLICTAEIEPGGFVNERCHDRADHGVTNLSWRP